MNLPNLKFKLPEWKEKDFLPLRQAEEQLSQWQNRIGTTSRVFIKHRHFIETCAEKKDIQGIQKLLVSRSAVRTLCTLWTDNGFREKFPLREEVLQTIAKNCSHIGRMSLGTLTGLYFRHYDRLGSPETITALSKLLEGYFASYERKGTGAGHLSRIASQRELLFSGGPEAIIRLIQGRKTSLDDLFVELGLQGYADGRFREICATGFYLDTLKDIPVGSNHDVLDMLKSPRVYETPLGNSGRTLGLAALEIIIDRSEQISDCWRQLVIAIAGDPRIPETSPGFRRWWQPLGEERIKKYKRWLSQIDLSVFLRIIAEYAEEAGNSQMKRMFPARKAFLEGLYHQGLVENTRLFLSKRAVSYLEKNYSARELPAFARLNDANRSVIYLTVNGYHVTEGSHSYKFWIFPYLPETSEILNSNVIDFHYRDLSSAIEENIDPEDRDKIACFTHNSRRFSWQVNIINHLRTLGVDPDIRKLFTASDFEEFKIVRSDMLC